MNEVKVITTYSQGAYFAVILSSNNGELIACLYGDDCELDVRASISHPSEQNIESLKQWCRDQLTTYNEPNEP